MFVHQSRSKLVNSGPWLLISVKLNADQLFWLKTSTAQQRGVFVAEVYWEMLNVGDFRRLSAVLWDLKQSCNISNELVSSQVVFCDQTGQKS